MSDRIKINWEGSLFVHHSLGMVNREILTELIKDERFDIRCIPFEEDQFVPGVNSKYYDLYQRSKETPFKDAHICVRHRFPPDFSTPESGKFILIQPWEYGSLPVEWRDSMEKCVFEIWVPSNYLMHCYVRSAVPQNKIKVVPNGVDPDFFSLSCKALSEVKELVSDRFCFLYNGGATLRKGTDILVNSYLNEFSSDENVCLVIKDSQMYGKNMTQKIELLSGRSDIAKIVYLSGNYEYEELGKLYAACDCYVHPYRAEGYGLPIAEAMACGKPVIVTGGGACLDFVSKETGYFLKYYPEIMKEKAVGELKTTDYPFWLVPDMDHLREKMRYVFDNRQEARIVGLRASEHIHKKHTWKSVARVAAERLIDVYQS